MTDAPTLEGAHDAPFGILEAYAFMLWMWKAYPHELISFAREYAKDKATDDSLVTD